MTTTLTPDQARDRETARRYLEAFGQPGFAYFLQGLSFNAACKRHREAGGRVNPTLEDQGLSETSAKAARQMQTNFLRRRHGLPPVAKTG